MCFVLRTTSVEDCVQEQRRAGQRPDADPTTNFYTVFISLELLIKLWCTIHLGTVDKLNYIKSLPFDLGIAIT